MKTKTILNNQEIATLYGRREHLNRIFIDISFIPRNALGCISDNDKQKYAQLLHHNDKVLKELQNFNSQLTTKQKKLLSQYHRALKQA